MLDPLNLVKALPAGWMWVGMLALVAAGWGHGYLTGSLHEAKENTAYEVAIETAAATRIEKTRAAIVKQKQLTQETSDAYTQSLAALHRHYAGRLRQPPVCGIRAVPAVPSPADHADAGAADAGSGAAGTAASIEEACAMTTLQLIGLQVWITEQQNIER